MKVKDKNEGTIVQSRSEENKMDKLLDFPVEKHLNKICSTVLRQNLHQREGRVTKTLPEIQSILGKLLPSRKVIKLEKNRV